MANCTSKMMRYCSPVGAWLILALGSGSTAQALDPNHKLTQYLHRTWQTQAGLSQASIYVVTQTRDGYLWVGTQSGVARFDGVEFQPIRALQSNSLGEVWARAMVEDAAGRVWMTTNDFQLIRVTGSSVKVFTEGRWAAYRGFFVSGARVRRRYVGVHRYRVSAYPRR